MEPLGRTLYARFSVYYYVVCVDIKRSYFTPYFIEVKGHNWGACRVPFSLEIVVRNTPLYVGRL
jgi:hypothetical protein